MGTFFDNTGPWKEDLAGFTIREAIGVPLVALTALTTSLANAFVILAVWKDPNRDLRRAPSNILIASQAFADFFVGLVQEPICIWWLLTLSDHAMYTIEALSSLLLVSSLLHMVFLAYDRYVAVATPTLHKYRITKASARWVILAIWLYSAVYMGYRTAIRELNVSIITVNVISGIHSVLPSFIAVLFYLRLLCVLRRYRKELGHLDDAGQAVINAYSREKKMTKAMVLILGIFLLVLTPWFVFYQVIGACTTCDENKASDMYFFCAFFYLFMLKSTLNPFLYAWRLPKYRAAYKRLVKPLKRQKRVRATDSEEKL